MPNFDGGHYFFTAVVPICNVGIVQHGTLKSSPIHMVREALETLPTALQSRVTEDVGIQSPFARSLRTHFARFVVLDQPFFNGRDHGDALVAAVRDTNLLEAQPVDTLACPYLLVMIDFDPADPTGKGEPRAYLKHLWELMAEELTAVFRYAYGFADVTDAESFADMMIDCQVETTMPFNDYWIGAPPIPSLSKLGLIAVPVAGFLLPLLVTRWGWWSWWHTKIPWWPGWLSVREGLLLAVALLLVGIAIDYFWVMRQGRKPFPAAPDATLRHVLKALYLQQAFTRFAAERQGADQAMLGAAFRAFLTEHKPADLDEQTQLPGVIRSHFPKAAT